MVLNTDFILAMIGGKRAKTAGILKNYRHGGTQRKTHSGKIGNPVVQVQEESKISQFS